MPFSVIIAINNKPLNFQLKHTEINIFINQISKSDMFMSEY